MNILSRRSTVPFLLAAAAVPAWAALSAQEPAPAGGASAITVTGQAPADLSGLTEGPEVAGVISARQGEQMQIT